MDPERWRRIEQICCETLELEPAQRKAFLEQSCSGDEPLRKEVDRLLDLHAEAENFIESPAVEVAARALFGERAGDSIEASGNTPAAVADTAKSEQFSPESGMADVSKKHPKYAPWWMYAVVAAFLIYAGTHYYNCFIQVDFLGFAGQAIRDERGTAIAASVDSVLPGSEASRVGLKPGDQIYYSNSGGFYATPGQTHSGPHYWKPGLGYRFEITHEGNKRIANVTLRRMPWSGWLTRPNYRLAIPSLLMIALHFALALLILFRRPHDPAAKWGALFLFMMACAVFSKIQLTGSHGIILSLPRVLGWLIVLLPSICEACVLPAGLTFASLFPRRLFHRHWIWSFIWLPAALVLPLVLKPA